MRKPAAGRAGSRPARALAPSEREEVAVEALVAPELGMEARCEKASLPRRDDRAVPQAREDLDAGSDAADARRADEHRVKGRAPELRDVEVRFEAVDLPAKGVALDGHVHERGERVRMAGHVLGNEDRPGAGAPDRHPLGDAVAELLDDPVLLRELADGRALTPGDDERIDLAELLRPAHVDRGDPEPTERGEVLREVALQPEDARARGQCGGAATG